MVKAHVVHAWDDTEQVEALLQYCFIASWYLWRSLELKPV
jgi:hypothetical protein